MIVRRRSSSSSMIATVMVSLLMILSTSATAHSPNDEGCKGGTCPIPSSSSVNSPSGKDNESCGLWMGPSPIKNAEEHGFGLGIFTGKAIAAGTPIESNVFGHGEILLPIFGNEDVYNKHPPLREYVWEEDNMPEVPVEYPDFQTALFIPGIAALAPCTSQNYNVQLNGAGTDTDKPRWSAMTDDGGVHRSKHPQAGAFSYRHNVTYVAVRDIAPGEELTVRCSDSDYDGGAYYLSRYSPDDNSVVCLDQNIHVDATVSGEARGLGIFAKRKLEKDAVITSTPLVPVMRKDMKILDPDDDPVNDQQLMLNYLYGHPDSDLLLLPVGPMVNYINHNHEQPNAEIRWHTMKENHQAGGSLQRRQEYHHPELFDVAAESLALVHGKGLMMDIVALRDIMDGEEILLDYGREWQEAWEEHKERFKKRQQSLTEKDIFYQSAEQYRAAHDDEVFRTLYEQSLDPYPQNLKFHCFYEQHDDEATQSGEVEDAYKKKLSSTGRGFRRFSWNDHQNHPCLRPCQIVERYESDEDDEPRYTVEMFRQDNMFVMYYCSISMDYRLTDVPHSDIKLLDMPYTPDVHQRWTFRHEIGVPEGFYPDAWMKKKLRKRNNVPEEDLGEKYKKKKPREVPASTMA
ncbi:SET methyltransferase domain containing protein [Nitzschia inconspicua]|uniref:SET methyltransferase domain containing protein n=1 Tax=Nitzschia inconspicua TaxID=303405 RepID=A0A9K3KQP8_9STRA|nr:SET methyltransferase domain containing protein [Nitzschia inconspicua]